MAAMMIWRRLRLSWAALVLLAVSQFAQADCAVFERWSVPQLQQEWRQLQPLKGHFDGAAWRPEVDKWQGRKYCVLEVLRQKFLTTHPSEQQVLQAMGAADASASPSTPPQLRTVPSACAGAMAATWAHDSATYPAWAWYSWRGMHDGMLILFQQGQVSHALWCLSLE